MWGALLRTQKWRSVRAQPAARSVLVGVLEHVDDQCHAAGVNVDGASDGASDGDVSARDDERDRPIPQRLQAARTHQANGYV